MKIEFLLATNTSTTISSVLKKYRKQKQNKPNLTDKERAIIYSLLKQSAFNGRLPRGVLGEISQRFGVKPRTVSRIWQQGEESIRRGFMYPNVRSKIKFNSGRKKNCKGLKFYQKEGVFYYS
jgi:hypothetical protein